MSSIVLQIGLCLLGAACLFAWTKGGPGERAGSTAVAVAWISSLAVQEFVPASMQSVALLMFDVALAAALLAIAIRYSSHWLGTAMLLQAFMLAMHADELGDEGVGRITYIVILNAASAAMLLTIVASTVGAWMKRVRLRRADMTRPPAPPPGVARPA